MNKINNNNININGSYYEVKNTNAAETYSEKGKVIGSCSVVVSRMKLGETNNDRFNIAVKIIKSDGATISERFSQAIEKTILLFRYVKIKEEKGESIYVNINSLSKRLHLSKNSIKKAANKGELEKLIAERLKYQSKVIDSYEAIYIQCIDESRKIRKSKLMKSVNESISSLYEDSSKNAEYVKAGKNIFFVIKTSDQDLQWTKISDKILGEGSFGVVKETDALQAKKNNKTPATPSLDRYAYKTANNEKAAYRDLKKEYEMLDKIHKKNTSSIPLRGIQAKPLKLVWLKKTKLLSKISGIIFQGDLTKHLGYLGKKYDADLKGSLQNPLEVRIQQTHDLLSGLAFLAKNRIVHRDLKMGNILVKKEADGTISTDIADFGGSMELPTKISGEYNFGTSTKAYTSEDCFKKAYLDWEHGNIEGSNNALLRNDVFAMGIVLYGLHAEGEYACRRNKKGFAIDASNFDGKKLLDSGLPKGAVAVLKKMLYIEKYPDYTAEQALTDFEAAIKVI